ncbi:MAG: DMT family transporter [Drouetiella hepatica Uher 2000/2452]|jgi:drug/metabolite transporter (DMT)-like permease|uniref:DMT family transporter n=1 Tax=Drouetiella hepatica Uher 2000/2452 TaxID=904376 RepID=A0A951UQ62_9CYAN|nr:DMT family transporter [Drouetiella hepatica Uher 2000/2452]
MTASTVFSPKSVPQASSQVSEDVGQWQAHFLNHISSATLKQALYLAWSVVQPFWGGIVLGMALTGVACASIFVVIAEQDLKPEAIAFNRLLIAAITFGGWEGLQHILAQQSLGSSKMAAAKKSFNEALGWRSLALFVVAGVGFAASFTCAAWSLTQTSVANSALLNNMMPIFTTLGAWLLLGKQFSLRFVLGLGVAISGVVAIGIQDLHVSSSQLTGDAAALGAAVLLASAILSVEQLRSKFSTSFIMMVISLIGSLAIVPALILNGDWVFSLTWRSGCAVFALALVSQVMGHGLLTYSLKQFSSGLISVSMLTIPVLSALLAMVLFGQQISMVNSFAFLIVLAGIYLSLSTANQQQSEF